MTSPRSSAIWSRLRALERRTRPVTPEVAEALARRWAELPEHVRNPAQLMGRKLTGCEGTHGVFPACDFACKPCYHSADANKVRVDGRHTVEQIDQQMAFLRRTRGPGVHAQLIGGEATLLDPEDHAEALEVMRRHERFPMSFSHGDFDYEYLRRLAVRPDGRRRFDALAFAIHIDSTMHGRTGAPHPESEAELNVFRRRTVEMFDRLRREHGVRHHLAHNMTVTPANLGQIAGVVRDCRAMGYRVFSFQPAAHVGNDRRWDADYRAVTDDAVWAEVERGVGRDLPYRAMQMGDLRCNRATWGLWVDGRYTPVFEDDHAADAEARDALYRALPGNFLFASRAVMVTRLARIVAANRRDIPTAASWVARTVRRGGGPRAFTRGVHPTTYVMHSFIDAAEVGPAWAALQRGQRLDDPRLRAAQERLEACAYAMGHPETGEIVPACVQHSVLDPDENAELAVMLPRRRRGVSAREKQPAPAAR
ncbi:radical SAM protein [Rhabdothermincola salaria]|uniref:radical SAM protein n=1 Tax=Rhabdothermincola salaria TaxID=2903142 RepID=UPI001E52151B|nr:radical SAM protein [Rhabdothermincola salaria]MCD9624247.1 radical SAM protein [Rhabdothermincola salaria]